MLGSKALEAKYIYEIHKKREIKLDVPQFVRNSGINGISPSGKYQMAENLHLVVDEELRNWLQEWKRKQD